MPIDPLIQAAPIDVVAWSLDDRFGIYPEGKRAKEARFAPAQSAEGILIAGRRYLFKRSRRAYAEQFWAEVVSYRIGCLLDYDVPPSFAAWNSETGICGALIEWFFVDGHEVAVSGGDFLQRIQPGFDRRRGTMHNLHDNERLMRALSHDGKFRTDWRAWWTGALLFDALIGNTDRHQDNWSVVFELADGAAAAARLSPYFDNGTSLGSELETARVALWTADDLNRHIARGKHHVRWRFPAPDHELLRLPHLDLLMRAVGQWPQTREALRSKILPLTIAHIRDALSDLPRMVLPVPLTENRLNLILRLLARSLELLQDALR
jgi:hypothetical protein